MYDIRRGRFVRKKQNIYMFLAFHFPNPLEQLSVAEKSLHAALVGLDWLECRTRKPAA